MEAVFRVEGDRVETRAHAGGPWDPTMQHGSAPSSLIVFVAERIATSVPMRVARVSVDLLRPVPVAPLEIRARVVREGRKLQLCAVDLFAAGDVEVARGSVLKFRRADLGIDPGIGHEPLDLPGPEAGNKPEMLINRVNPFLTGLSMRVVRGAFGVPGPGACWFRADRPLVEGTAPSPAMRAMVAGDFCNGASSVLDYRAWTFINGDLTVSLARDPVGDWVLLDARTWLGPDGGGIAFGRLGDAQGYFGRAIQSLVIDRR